MKTKQIVGIIITGLVIIAVGVSGVATNIIQQKLLADRVQSEQSTTDIMSTLFGGDGETINLPKQDFIGVLNIVGEIGANSSTSSLYGTSGYDHEMYMNYVEQMKNSGFNKGIFLYIDSPGGAVYQTDELYQKLLEYKEETGRPIWAYYASEACSGGYYISMAADRIYANRNAWTGSIGVIVSLLNCKGLYDKLGIKEIDITSGKNKAMGSMGLELTKEQQDILQSLVDEAYDQFVGIVATGREMDETKVRTLADGRIYSAKQALEAGLIDEIEGLEQVKEKFASELGCDAKEDFFTPKNKMSDFFNSLFGKAKELLPTSETDLAEDIVKNRGNGVLKYYAE